MTFTLGGPERTRRWFEATGRPIGAEGADQGGVVVIRDITERSLRRVEEEFLALASHELRTPLTPIRGYLTLLGRLLQTEGTDERARHYLARVQEEMARLQRLVDDLLDVGRLQEGKLHLESEALDLVHLVTQLTPGDPCTPTDPCHVYLNLADVKEIGLASGAVYIAVGAANLPFTVPPNPISPQFVIMPVSVPPNQVVTADISCDTGIR